MTERAARLMAAVTLAMLITRYLCTYPVVNSSTPGVGSVSLYATGTPDFGWVWYGLNFLLFGALGSQEHEQRRPARDPSKRDCRTEPVAE